MFTIIYLVEKKSAAKLCVQSAHIFVKKYVDLYVHDWKSMCLNGHIGQLGIWAAWWLQMVSSL